MTVAMDSLTALRRVVLYIVGVGIAAAAEPLHFVLMVSSTPTLNTSGVLSAVDQALDLVGNDATLLSGYTLQHSRILDVQVMIFNGEWFGMMPMSCQAMIISTNRTLMILIINCLIHSLQP